MVSEALVASDPLNIELIRRHILTYTVGRSILLYDAVPSTNAALRDLARAGAAEGTVVLAESQTAGRGRAGKPWFSPPGVNLYASVLFRPAIPPAKTMVFSFIASLALADAIGEHARPVAIKWPNDVLVKRRKVAGVLADTATRIDRVDYVILGVGVNLNVGRGALRSALGAAAQMATSLKEEAGCAIDRNAFTGTFVTYLDEWLAIYREQGGAALIRAWRDLDIVTGRRVEVREDATVLDGRALGLDAEGRLQIADARGQVHAVLTGDLRLLE